MGVVLKKENNEITSLLKDQIKSHAFVPRPVCTFFLITNANVWQITQTYPIENLLKLHICISFEP